MKSLVRLLLSASALRKGSYILLTLLILSSCQKENRYFPKSVPMADIHIERFDSALLSLDIDSIGNGVKNLYQEYPVFMPFFAENIIGIPSSDTSALEEALTQFLTDTVYGFQHTHQKVREVFASVDEQRKDLGQAFGRLEYLYPDIEVPEITFFVSGFNASVLFYNSQYYSRLPLPQDAVAVGVDMYLGADYEYYNQVVYNYQKQTMRPECLSVDVVSAYLFQQFPFESQKNRLLDQMMYRGKIMYLLSELFYEQPDYEIMGYTKTQWDWCVRHEADIWHLMMDQQDLFKTDPRVLSSYLNDGPFTIEISQDCPARIGTWIGWRIAECYMKHNTDLTLQALIADTDAQHILELSRYRP